MAFFSNKQRNKTEARHSDQLWREPYTNHTENKVQEDKKIFLESLNGGAYLDSEEDELPPPSSDYQPSRINIWKIIAATIFTSFIAVFFALIYLMWVPTKIDAAGYQDNGIARDLSLLVSQEHNGEIMLSEAEINRYIADTCRLRQRGPFSIISRPAGIALRVHDGYAELIIQRVIGSHFTQTNSVYINFKRVLENGRPVVKLNFSKGEKYTSGLNGGKVGLLSIPERYITLMQPTLEQLLHTYPKLAHLIQQKAYLPLFISKEKGDERYVILSPPEKDLSETY